MDDPQKAFPSIFDKLNGKLSIIQTIVASPYSPVLLLLLGIWLISSLSEAQYARLLQIWPLFEGPIGIGFVTLLLVMWINAFMFSPYLDKQQKLLLCLEKLNQAIIDTTETLKIYFQEVSDAHCSQNAYLTRIELALSAHTAQMKEVLRHGIILEDGTTLKDRRKTDKFHVPPPQETPS